MQSLEYILGRFEGIACGIEKIDEDACTALFDTCEMLADYIEKHQEVEE